MSEINPKKSKEEETLDGKDLFSSAADLHFYVLTFNTGAVFFAAFQKKNHLNESRTGRNHLNDCRRHAFLSGTRAGFL